MSLEYWEKFSPKELDIKLQNLFSLLGLLYNRNLSSLAIIDLIKRRIKQIAKNKRYLMRPICEILGVDHFGLISESLDYLKIRLSGGD
ncbi:MAG: hypothetical protein ACFFDH_09470 [Promethearchaeota archaeon]